MFLVLPAFGCLLVGPEWDSPRTWRDAARLDAAGLALFGREYRGVGRLVGRLVGRRRLFGGIAVFGRTVFGRTVT